MSNGDNPTMIVDIVPSQPAGSGWNPAVGVETNGLHLPAGGRTQIIEEALRILHRCVPPASASRTQTGLVVGYVQSGKTTSFTTLAALSRDNGYQMVIVIAGTTEPLFFQTRDRLIDTLRL